MDTPAQTYGTVVFILKYFPFPADTGGKLASYGRIVGLARITPVCIILLPMDDSEENVEKYDFSTPKKLGIEVLDLRGFTKQKVMEEIEAFLKLKKPKTLFLEAHLFVEFLNTSVRNDQTIKKVVVCYDIHRKLEAANMHRESLLKRVVFWLFQWTFDLREKRNLEVADVVVTVSLRDKEHFMSYGLKRVVYIPQLISIPTSYWHGEDSDYSIFVASSLWHYPNREGLAWFLKTVAPLIMQKYPDFRLKIVGDIKKADQISTTSNVTYLGYLSRDELSEQISGAAFSIVPILSGSGTKFKLLESLSMHVPVVATDHAREGLPDERAIPFVCSSDPMVFSEEVCKLMLDRVYRRDMSQKCGMYFEKHFDSPRTLQKWLEVMK
ncbi:MAG: glycosyltransferase family 4 protein [Candidatus Roizmanbacteria bacterium]